jgi:hypothetical protein
MVLTGLAELIPKNQTGTAESLPKNSKRLKKPWK